MNITSVALNGLHQAEAGIQKTASAIASAAGTEDAVSLSDAAVSLIENRNAFAGDIQTLKVADDLEREAIDL